MKRLSAFGFVVLVGCAHSYTLDPLGERPEYLNKIAFSKTVTPTCVFQAGYQYSNPNEMLVKIRVTNKQKTAFELNPSSFRMTGPKETLKSSPWNASDPEQYIKDLSSRAELLDSRTKMESYQGVEALTELKGGMADHQIDNANADLKRKQQEAESAKKESTSIRERIAILQPAALLKNTVKPGATVEGAIIFKTEFGETGVVAIESTMPSCAAKIQFMLKK